MTNLLAAGAKVSDAGAARSRRWFVSGVPVAWSSAAVPLAAAWSFDDSR
jgi:hypothetical protein